MAIPTWVSGQVLTASDVNSWFVPLAKIKSGTESVTSSTTLQNDDDLFVTVTATGTYRVELLLMYDASTAADLKVGFTGPAGAVLVGNASGLEIGATGSTNDFIGNITGISDTVNFGGLGAGSTLSAVITGTLRTTGTGGTFQLQWAQVASGGTATRVFADSHMTLWRIS